MRAYVSGYIDGFTHLGQFVWEIYVLVETWDWFKTELFSTPYMRDDLHEDMISEPRKLV